MQIENTDKERPKSGKNANGKKTKCKKMLDTVPKLWLFSGHGQREYSQFWLFP
jgi:hypothetical protein